MKATILEWLHQRRDAVDKRILDVLRAHGEMGIYELAWRVNARARTLYSALGRLEKCGNVRSRFHIARPPRRLYSVVERSERVTD